MFRILKIWLDGKLLLDKDWLKLKTNLMRPHSNLLGTPLKETSRPLQPCKLYKPRSREFKMKSKEFKIALKKKLKKPLTKKVSVLMILTPSRKSKTWMIISKILRLRLNRSNNKLQIRITLSQMPLLKTLSTMDS